MFFAVALVFELVNTALTAQRDSSLLATILNDLQLLILFGILLAYHLIVMRRDGRSAAAALIWDWQASDIAWGLWISSLVTGWVILAASILRSWVNATGFYRLHPNDDPAESPRVIQVLQLVARESGRGRSGLLVALGVTAFGVFTWFHFTIFHGILGAIMSVFLAAEPLPFPLLNCQAS